MINTKEQPHSEASLQPPQQKNGYPRSNFPEKTKCSKQRQTDIITIQKKHENLTILKKDFSLNAT
jgi:hypothetical protein